MAFDTIKLMKKLGYSIIKQGDTALHNELMRKLKNEGDAKVCECGASILWTKSIAVIVVKDRLEIVPLIYK